MTGRVPEPAELADDLAEIKAAIDAGARETRAMFADLLSRIESTYVRQDVYNARHSQLVERVSKVEERHTWVSRTAVAALLLPVVVMIVALIVSGGGVQ